VAEPRKPTKKWIVDKVVVSKWSIVVPLLIDPETGEFWFEYPERTQNDLGYDSVYGKQYVGPNRKLMTQMIHRVVEEHQTLDYQQFIAVLTSPEYGDGSSVPKVGFEQLIRFEMASAEIKSPSYRSYKKGDEIKDIERLNDPECPDWAWSIEKVTAHRHFPGDTKPFYNSGRHESNYIPNHHSLVFPYSEELWNSLVMIHAACLQMHDRLRDLLTGEPDEVLGKLLAIGNGTPLLPGPTENDTAQE